MTAVHWVFALVAFWLLACGVGVTLFLLLAKRVGDRRYHEGWNACAAAQGRAMSPFLVNGPRHRRADDEQFATTNFTEPRSIVGHRAR